MKAIITGAGRGGTNLLTEMVRATGLFHMSDVIVEDRLLFSYDTLPENYATKLATENDGVTYDNCYKLLSKYPDLELFFVFRHPVAHCLSKIYRGRPENEGGDGGTSYAKDATVNSSIEYVKYSYSLYCKLNSMYPSRVHNVRMEDIITNIQTLSKILLTHIQLNMKNAPLDKDSEILSKMVNSFKYNRNSYQRNRYGNNLNTNQANVHNNWQTEFNGYFSGNLVIINKIQHELSDLMKFCGYKNV